MTNVQAYAIIETGMIVNETLSSRFVGYHPTQERGGCMIDPASVVTGVATGYITQKSIQKTDEIIHPNAKTPQDDIIDLLKAIRDGVAPKEKDSINFTMQLQPFPSEYIIPDDLNDRSHVCVFFFTSTPLRYDGVFGGSYTATVGPGWKQLDIPGRLSTTDGLNHVVVVSYREDALGSSL